MPIDDQSVDTTDNTATSGDLDAPNLLDTISGVVADTLAAASGSTVPVADLHGGEGDEERISDYWDAADMAPLNAASAVSICP